MELMERENKFVPSEFGNISNEWRIAKLKECLSEKPKYGIGAAAIDYNQNYLTYLRITDISDEGRLIKEDLKSVDHPQSNNYILQPGEIVFARTGASVGKSYLYNSKDGKLVYAGFLIKVKPDPQILLPEYLKHFVSTKYYWNWILFNSMRSGQPGINSREVQTLRIPLPPTLAEQKAIATALSDVDALITQLDKLIEKKKAIKQGAMQQLLTGKKRLAGFGEGKGYKQTQVGVIPEDWEVRRLGELAQKIMVGIASAATHAYTNKGIPMFRNQNIKPNKLKTNDILFIRPDYEVLYKNKRLKAGDLLTARTGYPGTTSIVPKEFEGAQSFTTLITRLDEGCNSIFVSQLMNSEIGKKFFEASQIGGGQKNVNAAILRNMPIPLPPTLKEQKAIAKVLTEMDAEIISLEVKKGKYERVKEGMMQELLTGKTRLIV
ncbi:MAG: restriction endonuclease subunit S [Bacteroidota bacterium]